MAAQDLKERTAKGLIWGLANNGSMQVLNLVFGIVLGRLLCEADYGLAGEVAVFTAIASALQESGFISALINRKNATAEDFNSVFWFNVTVSASIYGVLFLAAPLLRRENPDFVAGTAQPAAVSGGPCAPAGSLPLYEFRAVCAGTGAYGRLCRISRALTQGVQRTGL